MTVGYEAAVQLFRQGKLVELTNASGRDEVTRRQLEPRHGALLANALALVGDLEAAEQLATVVSQGAQPAAARSQAEWTLGLIAWLRGDLLSAVKRARVAVRLAEESSDVERIAWAYLHSFRLLIETGSADAVTAILLDARRAVARAGIPQATAYLHNCVAVLEGQTGRFNEARRHLDIAESLLEIGPNAWLAGLVSTHRAAVACHTWHFEVAASHLHKARETVKESGYQHIAVSAEATLGYLEFLVGDFEKAKTSLRRLRDDPRITSFLSLAALDTLARVHLALGELDECNEALRGIEDHVNSHPEVATVFHIRWTEIVRARLLSRCRNPTAALERLQVAEALAARIGDTPLRAAVQIERAQILGGMGKTELAAASLLGASDLGVAAIPDLQAQYYRAAAVVISGDAPPLARQLEERAHRLWRAQGVIAVPLEMGAARSVDVQDVRPAESTELASIECIANSLATFSDVAHRPSLLGQEILALVKSLGCAPDAKIIATRERAQGTMPSSDTFALPLGVERDRSLTFVCKVPTHPAKAMVLGDVLRLSRAALELACAREEKRNRAALWPAPPIEEQAGALFLAEEMKTLLTTARRIAPTTVPVLISGETGTGKEVLARTIHAYSSRAAATFLPFNCSSVPKEMLDSQLFGHRRGAFTGAMEHFPGVIRAAAGGTLFLDEIAETTLDVQPKLLRFLESNEVHPIGETHPSKTDVRVIAATNADLDALVAEGRFREDLFYRLNIVRLHVPPLRERRVEIPTLAHHYSQKHAQEYRKGNLRLAEETMEYLVLYRWPGNVRQLANEMRRLAALAEADAVLMPEHLSSDIAASRKTVPAAERMLEATEIVVRIDQPMTAAIQHLECAMIQHALRLTGGRMEEAASLLGLSRKGLYLKRVRYGLEAPDGAGAGEVELA